MVVDSWGLLDCLLRMLLQLQLLQNSALPHRDPTLTATPYMHTQWTSQDFARPCQKSEIAELIDKRKFQEATTGL